MILQNEVDVDPVFERSAEHLIQSPGGLEAVLPESLQIGPGLVAFDPAPPLSHPDPNEVHLGALHLVQVIENQPCPELRRRELEVPLAIVGHIDWPSDIQAHGIEKAA